MPAALPNPGTDQETRLYTRIARPIGALAIVLLSAACVDDGSRSSELVTGVPTGSITTTRTGSTVSLRVRDSVQLQTVVLKRSIRWSSSNPSVASVSRQGVVAGLGAGTTVITASSTSGIERTTVGVVNPTVPTLISLSLSPGTVQLSPGRTQQFSVAARWSDGSTSLPPLTYMVTGGTISSSGMYTAGSAVGTFMVIAACACGVADTSAVSVQLAAPAPTVTALRISPRTASLAPGASVQLSASSMWSNGDTSVPPITYTAIGGGTVNASSGLYVAPATAGTYRVVVSSTVTPIRDTATITVTAPAAQLVSLQIAPRTASVTGGATVQFSATALWSTGATTLPPVTYTAPNGGSVSPTGTFVAPTVSGTYRVVVGHTNGTARDTALVTVTGTTSSPTPPPTNFTRNIPQGVGLQLFFDTRFGNMLHDQLNADSIGYVWDGRNATDATAPFGPNVFETFYPAGSWGNGGGAKIFDRGGRNWRRVYFSLMMFIPSNYSTHSNEEKFWYPYVRVGSRLTVPFNLAFWPKWTPSAQEMTWQIRPEPGRSENISTGAGIPKGRWTNVEVFMQINTPGARNGILRAWVDGQVSINRSDILYYTETSAQGVFDGIRFDGTRGGGTSTEPVPVGGQVRKYNRLAFYFAN